LKYLGVSKTFLDYFRASGLVEEHLESSRHYFESFSSFLWVLEASQIFPDNFRSIYKVLDQFKQHIEGSGLL